MTHADLMGKTQFSRRRLVLAKCCWRLVISTWLLGSTFPATAAASAGTKRTHELHVRVLTRRTEDRMQVWVRNSELCEVTVTFVANTVNLRSTVKFPYTATFKPGETEAFVLSPTNPAKPWSYAYTNFYELGSTVSKPDGTIYSLPYLPGQFHLVTQGYNGKFSHFGENEYAIDWGMPVGTPVCVARGGLVVKVKDDSAGGGPSLKYDPDDNYILIRHADGTLGQYCHLLRHGAKVTAGQMVHRGQVIALSGDTGFSTGPHLHFCVFKAKNGCTRSSIPVKFRTAHHHAITLLAGHRYRAPADADRMAALDRHKPA